MSTQLTGFAGAAEGQVPEGGTALEVRVMGRDMGTGAATEVAAAIGQFARDGVARPVNLVTVGVVAEPGGGLAPKGHENANYRYRGGEMFGVETPSGGKPS